MAALHSTGGVQTFGIRTLKVKIESLRYLLFEQLNVLHTNSERHKRRDITTVLQLKFVKVTCGALISDPACCACEIKDLSSFESFHTLQ